MSFNYNGLQGMDVYMAVSKQQSQKATRDMTVTSASYLFGKCKTMKDSKRGLTSI